LHMRQEPHPCSDDLFQWVGLCDHLNAMPPRCGLRKENRDQGKPYSFLVNFIGLKRTLVFFAKLLEEQAVDCAMQGADARVVGFKIETNVKGGVSRCLY
jgi:hypothetical protein